MIDYKVLITTSGTGSRLGEVTKYLNKALVRIGKKPAISYIVESYPKDVTIVVTVGYLASQIKEFLPLAYPERKFEFVQVDKYEGEGSSLGFSMLQAENNLQCPFIFHSCDTIVTEPIPAPTENWVGGYMVDKINTKLQLSQYRTHKIVDSEVKELKEKGDPDFESIHIGLIGVNDYDNFWSTLQSIYEADKISTGHSDVHVVDRMIKESNKFKLVPYQFWFDTGNLEALEQTRKEIGGDFKILDKEDESIFIFDKFVIKFFSNPKNVVNRVKRAEVLKGLTPMVEGSTEHFYRYEYVEGDLLSRVVDKDNFYFFLEWAKTNLWEKEEKVEKNIFKEACYKFYRDKTKERITKILSTNSFVDEANIINGISVPTVAELLSKVDFDLFSNAQQYRIHGDFVLDNILKTPSGYCLLDWRQDFGGLIEVGDLYYDLGKLNHNLTVNHDIINQNLFTIKIDGRKVECYITLKDNLAGCKEVLEKFVIEQGWDWKRVEIITAIIWINMSPLHHHPFNQFLYFFGKLNLWKALNQ